MSTVEHAPTRVGAAVAVVAALVAVAATGIYAWVAFGLGLAGVTCLGVGAVSGRSGLVTGGAALLFGCVLVGGVLGAPTVPLLVGAVATVVAWDSAQTGIVLGEQLGRNTPATRIELVHVGGTALVGVVAVAAGYGIFRIAQDGQAPGGFFFLLVAAVVLASAVAARR